MNYLRYGLVSLVKSSDFLSQNCPNIAVFFRLQLTLVNYFGIISTWDTIKHLKSQNCLYFCKIFCSSKCGKWMQRSDTAVQRFLKGESPKVSFQCKACQEIDTHKDATSFLSIDSQQNRSIHFWSLILAAADQKSNPVDNINPTHCQQFITFGTFQ